MKWKPLLVCSLAPIAAILCAITTFGHHLSAQGRGAAAAPAYRVVPLWPRPFRDDAWVLGSITGVTVDAQNHVWVAHRGADSLETNEKGMVIAQPSSSVCCTPAPPILEFDANGNLVSSWAGPAGDIRPQVPGGMPSTKGNVWIAPPGSTRRLPRPAVAAALRRRQRLKRRSLASHQAVRVEALPIQLQGVVAAQARMRAQPRPHAGQPPAVAAPPRHRLRLRHRPTRTS